MSFGIFCCLSLVFVLTCCVVYEMFSNHIQKKITLERDGVYVRRVKDKQFNVYLSRKNFQKLEELREAAGKSSLEETLRCALKLYDKEKHGG